MSRDLLKVVIDQGVRDNLNTFFLNASNDYSEIEDNLSIYDDDRFANFQTTGEIVFNPNEKMVVVTAEVAVGLTERSGKKAQYEKAKRILKDYMKYDAGIFVFSDPAGSFRFSLVYGQAEGIRKSWSNFRRFTYFVSKDQTNKTFYDRVGNCGFASLQAIKDAFSVEKVTKGFYKQVADWYFWAVQNVTFPKDAEAEDNGRNIAVIRLITRLIFIWFMRERKLVSPDLFSKDTAASLLMSFQPEETTYYKAILQNLFFSTLNTRTDERKFRFTSSYHGRNIDYMDHGIYRYEDYFKNREDMLALFKGIPFLNGGLFDCLDWSAKESGMPREVRFDGFSDREVGLSVPNYLFFSDEREADLNAEYGTKNKKYRVQGLLNILSAYNFTIDENDPNDQEVALDPELLGKVFENLLASFNPETATTARKATGSYYTPREIVDYMVTQSLKQYFKTHLDDVVDIDNKLEELLSPITTDEPVNPFGADDSRRVVRLTEELRVVDPAVGSGAFPMGILNKLVSVLARVDRDNRLWQETQLRAVDGVTDLLLKQKLIKQINEQFSERNSNYGRKLYLIQKCIYGVDIQQIAIEIAKLRFFIALLVDERIDKSKPNWGIEPLPNLDFKLMQGNSLVSEFVGINLDAEDSSSYGKLMKDETEELVSEYRNKKTDYQYEPDRTKREALKYDIDKLIVRIFESKLQSQKAEYLTKLRNIERKYAGVSDARQRDKAISKDTDALNRNYGFDLAQAEKQLKEFTGGLKVKPFFSWRLYFAEVFHEKGGFDIVIANPPYIGEKSHKDILRLVATKPWGRQFYQRKMDLFYFFFHLALDIGAENASLCFISTNYWITADGASKLRLALKQRATLLRLVSFGELKLFSTAQGQHNMITLMTKGVNDAIAHTIVTKRVGEASTELLWSILTGNDSQTLYHYIKQKHLYDGPTNYIRLTPTSPSFLEAASKSSKQVFDFRRIDQASTSLKNCAKYVFMGIQTGCDVVTPKLIKAAQSKKLINTNEVSNYPIGKGIYVLTHQEINQINLTNIEINDCVKPFYKNSDIQRYLTPKNTSRYILYVDSQTDIDYYPNIKNYLERFQPLLAAREQAVTEGYNWYWIRGSKREPMFYRMDTIVVPYRATSSRFSICNQNIFGAGDLYYISLKRNFSTRALLGFLNSSLVLFHLQHRGKRKGQVIEYYKKPLEEIPIHKALLEDDKSRTAFENVVDEIIMRKHLSNTADTTTLERQIDEMVYELYGLTPEEREVVEGTFKK